MSHDVAVIGVSCRFPGADDAAGYWRILAGRESGISQVPPSRWDLGNFYDPDPKVPGKANTRWGGFLGDPCGFDCDFFNISEEEAIHMDPQQRLMLELAWEALEDAGIAPDSLRGTGTGVYVGISHNDYERIIYESYERITRFHGTGSYQSVAANRISYFLHLVGPSMTLDTACSSSLTALHTACQALRLEPMPLALVGGVTLHLTPHETLGLTKGYMLSAGGQCRSFQPSADGYVRGEGGGMLVLKRLEDARRDGNFIYGVLKGSAVNHNGRSNGLSAPSSLSLRAVMQQALACAGLEARDVSLLEAHGTGTRTGDQIELRAIKEVYEAPDGQTLWLGCAKTNIGHLESASGMAGLIKVLLAFKNECIPPNLHCEEETHPLGRTGSRLQIPATGVEWRTGSAPRVAGITTYGFGGANAHLIVQEPPAAQYAPGHAGAGAHVLALSARDPDALRQLVEAYAHFLEDAEDEELEDICRVANAGRSHFEWRAAFVAEGARRMGSALQHWLHEGGQGTQAARGLSPTLWFSGLPASQDWQYLLLSCPALDVAQPTTLGPPGVHLAVGRLLARMGLASGGVAGAGPSHAVARTVATSENVPILPEIQDAQCADVLLRVLLKPNGEPFGLTTLHATPPRLQLMDMLGRVYAIGARLQWAALYGTSGRRPRRTLPSYPFQRRHLWFMTSATKPRSLDCT